MKSAELALVIFCLWIAGPVAGDDSEKAYLGVHLANVQKVATDEWYLEDATDGREVVMISVSRNTPAAYAGLHTGDILVQFNGKVINTRYDVVRIVQHASPADTFSAIVWRDGEQVIISGVLGAIPIESHD